MAVGGVGWRITTYVMLYGVSTEAAAWFACSVSGSTPTELFGVVHIYYYILYIERESNHHHPLSTLSYYYYYSHPSIHSPLK